MPAGADPSRRAAARRRALGGALAAALLLGLAILGSLSLGARPVAPGEALSALWSAAPQNFDQAVVRLMRVPRTLAGLLVGASLGVAGLLLQTASRNPLADPGVLGISAGAALAAAVSIRFLGAVDAVGIALAACGGAAAAGAAVGSLGGVFAPGGTETRDDAGAARLVLAGAAVGALCLAGVSAITLADPETRDRMRFWTIGALGAATPERLVAFWPLPAAGLALAALCARGLDALALGAEAARSLGRAPELWAALALLAAALLTGGATALAGPVAFAGLIAPHLARKLAGPGMAAAGPAAAALGAALTLACDTAGRLVAPPGEIQTAAMLGLIGGPAFLLLMRGAGR